MLRTKTQDLLDKFEHQAHLKGIHAEKIHYAKYALVAFIDETISISDWSHKNEWLSQPLQLRIIYI